MKKFNLLFYLLCVPLFLTGQEKYIKWSKIRVQGYPDKICHVRVLNNEEHYQFIKKAYREDQSGNYCGYDHEVDINFIKTATKFKTDSGVCYAMHFSLEKGENFDLMADEFVISEGSKLVLSDSINFVLEEYDENTEVRKVEGKDFMPIGKPTRSVNEFTLTLYAPDKETIKKCRLHIRAIGVRVIPMFPGKKVN